MLNDGLIIELTSRFLSSTVGLLRGRGSKYQMLHNSNISWIIMWRNKRRFCVSENVPQPLILLLWWLKSQQWCNDVSCFQTDCIWGWTLIALINDLILMTFSSHVVEAQRRLTFGVLASDDVRLWARWQIFKASKWKRRAQARKVSD